MMGNFKTKRFRYGTFSTAMMLFAVVIFVLVNLVAGEFNRSFDLTQDGIFTLSHRSHDFLQELDQGITITHITQLGQMGELSQIVAELLNEYEAASPHIAVQERDPSISPTLIHQFAQRADIDDGIPNGSVVVENDATGRLRVIRPGNMLTLGLNQFGEVEIRSYNFEAEITRAIHYVTQGATQVVYYVTGSGELGLEPGLAAFLTANNFDVREVNLVANDVPDTADILLIPMPWRDWTEAKANRVTDFLMDDGRAFIALDLTPEDRPVFNSVLASYGIAPINHMVLEGDGRHFVSDAPYIIFPTLVPHEIFRNVQERGFINLMFNPVAIDVLDMRRASTVIEPLWVSSNTAYARVNMDELTINRLPTDLPGPFNLGVTITDTRFVQQMHTTQIVVISNMAVLLDIVNEETAGGNHQFVLDSLRWLAGEAPGIFIPGVLPPGAPILITQVDFNIMVGIAVGLLPIASIAIGIVIWARRRHN